MAQLREYWRCPVCQILWETQKEANMCKNSHSVTSEIWAESESGKAVKVNPYSAPGSMGSSAWALREAELSDYTDKRKAQLEYEKGHGKLPPTKPRIYIAD